MDSLAKRLVADGFLNPEDAEDNAGIGEAISYMLDYLVAPFG
jgi:hypothetical protein